MEGKFISPIAIRALCFTSCLVKPLSDLCPQAKGFIFYVVIGTLNRFGLTNQFHTMKTKSSVGCSNLPMFYG